MNTTQRPGCDGNMISCRRKVILWSMILLSIFGSWRKTRTVESGQDQDRSVGFLKENQKADVYSVYPGVFTSWMFGLWFSLTVHGLQIGAPQCCRVAIICWLAYVGGVVKKNTKTWDLCNTLGLQQHMCTGATRQPAEQWRHGDVTGPQIRIKLALFVFVSWVMCWLVRYFAHLPITCRTRGYSGLQPHPSSAARIPVHTGRSRETIDTEDTMHNVLRRGWVGTRFRRVG